MPRTALPTTALLLTVFAATACGGDGPRIDVGEDPVARDWSDIVERDTLVALTEFNSTSTFVYRGETMGYEHDLLRAFAEAHDLELRIEVLDERDQLINRLNRGEADVSAGRLIPSQIEQEHIRFTERLYHTRPVVVQRSGAAGSPDVPGVVDTMMDSLPPALEADGEAEAPIEVRARLVRNPSELAGREVAVAGGAALHERLIELEDTISGDIEIVELEDGVRTEGLLRRIADGRLELGVAPENVAALSSEYYGNITVQPTLGGPYGVAWAVRETSPELLQRLNEWIASDAGEQLREQLYQKYYVDRYGYRERGRSGYLSSETGRISEFDELLQAGAQSLGWDWRLLAAQTYQESKFQPRARSWAGAMGLLQLMPGTAREMNVSDPYDPADNVNGGVRYLQWLAGLWEQDVPDPDERLKFVLASYNTGRGHVQDAQRLAAKNGGDPQVWDDVAYWLLQKSKRAVYTDPVVQFGFSRGLEPVTYVAKILDRYSNYEAMVSARAAEEASGGDGG